MVLKLKEHTDSTILTKVNFCIYSRKFLFHLKSSWSQNSCLVLVSSLLINNSSRTNSLFKWEIYIIYIGNEFTGRLTPPVLIVISVLYLYCSNHRRASMIHTKPVPQLASYMVTLIILIFSECAATAFRNWPSSNSKQ